MRMLYAPALLGPILLLMGLLAACERPENFSTSGEVDASRDSVRFDTLFTTQQSPTQRLLLYNRSGGALRISAIYVGGGQQSPFRLILNGVEAQRHEQIELGRGDSLYCFFRTRITTREQDEDVTDVLRIETDGRVEEVVLYAHVLDAYLISDSVLACNSTLPTDKPIVVDGYMRVAEGCELTIPAGARLFFTARQDENFNFTSQIQVLGKLSIQGTPQSRVQMSNFRLGRTFDVDWQETAGLWGGIHFTRLSQGSVVQNLLLKNASIGIRVDSIPNSNSEPKVRLRNVELRNFSNFAILGLGASSSSSSQPSILAENVLAYNAGQSVVGLFFGGLYAFNNCTLADYDQVSSGNQPAVALSNFLSGQDGSGQAVNTSFPTEVVFSNTVIWGSKTTEFGVDFRNFGGPLPVLSFEYCLLKADVFEAGSGTNQFNQDPLFQAPRNRLFAPLAGSPLINAGSPLTATTTDLLDQAARGIRDIGAIEGP
jgi:hypothetical protein